MILIREVKESDTPALEKLFMTVRQQVFVWESPKNFKLGDFKKSTEGEKVFVAEKDNSMIVGFVSIWEPGGSFIHNLFVYPEFQGLGIGRSLLDRAVGAVPKPITMKVVTHNIKACKFYERRGWKHVSTDEEAEPPYHAYRYDIEIDNTGFG